MPLPNLGIGALVRIFWYGLLALLLAVLWDSRTIRGAWSKGWASTLLAVVLLIMLFVLIERSASALGSWTAPPATPPEASQASGGEAFPTPLTIATAIVLLLLSGAVILGLLWSLGRPDWLAALPRPIHPEATDALVVMLAAAAEA